MTLELREQSLFFLALKNVTYCNIMGFQKQSLLYNSFLNMETCEVVHLFFCPLRSIGSGVEGSSHCPSVGLICQAEWIDLIRTLNLLCLKNTFIINVAWWSAELELYCSHNTLSLLFIKTTCSSFCIYLIFFSSPFFFPCFSLGDFPSLGVLKVKSHFSLHWAQLALATGFSCAALSHSGALQVQPAALTIDYVSWVSKNRASF